MKKAMIYIHGKGGSIDEAEHYRPLFPDRAVIGFDYKAETPWEAKDEFTRFFVAVRRDYEGVSLLAGSIGAYFAMQAATEGVESAYFISPVVDMEQMITDMMRWSGVTEDELHERGEIETSFGETLSWDYLRYVREHPIRWGVPTHILYGERDTLVPFGTVSDFAKKHGATLEVMPGGEHWFHTPEQMAFLDDWLRRRSAEARPLLPDEIPEAIGLIWEVFLRFEAPVYPEEGVRVFRASLDDPVRTASMRWYGAFEGGRLVGVLCMRAPQHVADFFVKAERQGQGYGRRLFERMKQDYAVKEFTVNSSPYGVPIYRRLGFVETDSEQCVDGLIFTPMKYSE